MEELQVPVRKIAVEIHTGQGERMLGSMFLTETPYQTGCPEDIVEVLNDERAFLPFQAEEPETGTMILNKGQILRVRPDEEVPLEMDDEFSSEELGKACTLVLIDGSSVTGRVGLETPAAQSRLVDKLNQAGRFVRVVGEGGVEFVHCDHVVRVI